MLATSACSHNELPHIYGLNAWDSDGHDGCANSKKETVDRKNVIYTNHAPAQFRDQYQILHAIMSSHRKMSYSYYINNAIYEFSEREWEFLGIASKAYGRLVRMSRILPGFAAMVRNPRTILYNFCSETCVNNYPSALYGRVSGEITENELRYRLSMYVSIGGEIYSIFAYSCDMPLARAICAILFSRPYRQDLFDCPLHEIEEDARRLGDLFRKYSRDFDYTSWNANINACTDGYLCKAANLLLDYPVLRQMAKKPRSNEHLTVHDLKPELLTDASLSAIPSWFADNLETYKASGNINPLPQTAVALNMNPLSGAIIPMYLARDECGLTIALVPESKSVWDAMIRIYRMERHDALYPESLSTQILLSPQNTHFSQEMSDRYNLVYLGLQSLGVYIEEIDKLEGGEKNPDYQFHGFVIGSTGQVGHNYN